jgi:hypothetical protein
MREESNGFAGIYLHLLTLMLLSSPVYQLQWPVRRLLGNGMENQFVWILIRKPRLKMYRYAEGKLSIIPPNHKSIAKCCALASHDTVL